MNYVNSIMIVLSSRKKLKISHNLLSNYCTNVANKYDIEINGVNKLVPYLVIKVSIFFVTRIFSRIYH